MTRAQDVDAAFVRSKRAMRASWGAIARMTGCAEIELRRRFDPAGVIVASAPPPAVAGLSLREKARRALEYAGLDRDAATIVARLWHAGGGLMSSQVLAAGIAGGGAAQDECKRAREAARARLGLKFRDRGFALSPADLVLVSRRIEEWEARP